MKIENKDIIFKKKIPATWLLKKFILVANSLSSKGLLFSIIKRTDLIDPYGLERGSIRKILRKGKLEVIRVLTIGDFLFYFLKYL